MNVDVVDLWMIMEAGLPDAETYWLSQRVEMISAIKRSKGLLFVKTLLDSTGGLRLIEETDQLIVDNDSASHHHVRKTIHSGVSRRSIKHAIKAVCFTAQHERLLDTCANEDVPHHWVALFI